MTALIEALRTPEERFVRLPNYTFRPLVNGVDAQALVSFQIVEVMRPEGVSRQLREPVFRRP